jgi:hypothetical protein
MEKERNSSLSARRKQELHHHYFCLYVCAINTLITYTFIWFVIQSPCSFLATHLFIPFPDCSLPCQLKITLSHIFSIFSTISYLKSYLCTCLRMPVQLKMRLRVCASLIFLLRISNHFGSQVYAYIDRTKLDEKKFQGYHSISYLYLNLGQITVQHIYKVLLLQEKQKLRLKHKNEETSGQRKYPHQRTYV